MLEMYSQADPKFQSTFAFTKISAREGLEVLTAELGNRAGMVGAAKLAWQLVDLRKESIMGGD